MQFLNRRTISAYVLILFSVALMSGCGGSSSSAKAAATVTNVDIFPTSISLTPGQITTVFAQAVNSSGGQVFTQTITFNSSNPAIQITANGLLCAGRWDSLTTPLTCYAPGTGPVTTPPTPPPDPPVTAAGITSNITASAGGVTSPTAIASIHLAVTSVVVTPSGAPSPACVQEAGTQVYKAIAYSGPQVPANDITSTVGTFSWASSQPSVATIPATGDSGFTDQATATAVHPGDSNIRATIGTVNPTQSTSAVFEQCLVKNISVTVPAATPPVANDSDSHFEIATGSTRALTVVVTDTSNHALTTLPTLNWNSTQPAVATVGSTSTGATVSGVAVGAVGISASCLPNNCNIGTNANVTSNLVTGTVTGTPPTSATVYVTCTEPAAAGACNSGTLTSPQVKLFPVNGTTLGTAITLPHVPNSMMINPQNSRIYLGSTPDGNDTSAGLMVVDAGANTFSSTIANAPGKVLAVAPNGNAVAVSNDADVFLYNGSTVTTLISGTSHILNATAAAFSPDSGKLLITTSTGDLWFEVAGATPTSTASAFTSPKDISFLPSGTFSIAATAGGLIPVQTCDQTVGGSVAAGGFDHVVGVPTTLPGPPTVGLDSVVATASPDIHRVDFVVAGTGGPPPGCPFSLAPTDHTTTTGGFTANQLVLSADSTHAFVISGTHVIDYDIAGNSFVDVVLSSGNAKTGGVAANGSLYVGGGADTNVHVIAAGVEGTPIGATIPADLVVAKSH